MDHNPSPLARVTERYKKLDRWAQWATILALPLTALATLASLAALGGATGTASLPPSPPATSAPPASTVATQAGTAGSGVVALKSHAPASFASSCRAQAADVETAGLTAAIVCVPGGDNMPGSVQYYQYSDPADMNTAFENYAGGASVGGSCGDQPGARGTYNLRSSGATLGSWACYTDSLNRSVMMWTNNSLNILSMALSTTQTPQQLHDWFFGPTDPGPD